ncbi:uncharacterized protein MEPE_01740 [Melanopsichium pennsylvanicum]|uniref:Uncharacterized protein n=2 Tax=Melanopsichium pennsylvanicum TaxID=63383 RepID=A0AAJ4XI53_9BASI|nr:conserved hypothetical protein [Melanopsichium pennsylvanicum 4]SNX83034.1 uncharacterized protein MEPE_01740 [Melanopsichium pennsylvanicum]
MIRFPKSSPIRLVLFDAFDTLVTPRSAPHLQYASIARQYGFNISDEDVKSAFKHAFRTTSKEHPNYGLETDIASPDEWWELVIRRTFSPERHSGISVEHYDTSIGDLSQRLVTRFGTSEAYDVFPDVVPTLSQLTQTNTSDGKPILLTLATNSDSRILSVLKSFGLDQYLELDVDTEPDSDAPHRPKRGPTLSYFEKCAKPDKRFFHAAFQRAAKTTSFAASSHLCTSLSVETHPIGLANVLYVGDQLHEDFWGAIDAGVQAAWLQRPTNFESNQPYQQIGQYRSSPEEQRYVRERTITNLGDVINIVTNSHEIP